MAKIDDLKWLKDYITEEISVAKDDISEDRRPNHVNWNLGYKSAMEEVLELIRDCE